MRASHDLDEGPPTPRSSHENYLIPT
jgi:hypothetical protein